ncbi:MAG TPA: glycoside hydrolase family 3 protein [Candidatus Limnocylindrales bacterium]|nr:glycoside hydrolase family 3 protein [Candidatus Limnocylindrales bacterium]
MLGTAAIPSAGSGAPADDLDRTLGPDVRAPALLARMTVDEKIGQMTQLESDSVRPAGVTQFLLGSVLSGGDGTPPANTPAAWYEMVSAYQQAALGTRLGIPILYGIDAVHGNGKVVGATIFPHNVGLGALDDPALVSEIGRATAREMTAIGVRWDFGPVLAVPQDVRWGRTYEGYGEDPALVERLSVAFITGLQGTDLAVDGSVAATAKHFLGDGGTTWGSASTNGFSIDQGVTGGDEATLRAIHLGPYRTAIGAGARIVMASFSSTSAGKVHGDHHLLTDVLKGELGFTGFVVSDWGGVDQVDPDYATAVARSIMAGVDMVMVPSDAQRFQTAVRQGLASGAINPDRIDDAVLRILRVKFEMGLFEQAMPPAGDAGDVGSSPDRALARTAVAGSAVLLKASSGVLPIGATGTVLLSGPAADDIGRQSGGWTVTWQGATGATTPGTTIADALAAGLGARLTYDGRTAFGPDTRGDTGIVVVGEYPYAEGRGDSATLALPPDDLALVAAMRPRVAHLVVVVLSGRPVILDEILDQADALIAAWLPGTEGTGIADVLLGDTPFRGTTPYTWPATPDDAPRTGRGSCAGAVFPVGFGLDATGLRLGPAACAGTTP